jgi:putative flavoprotein involved in K+ transport
MSASKLPEGRALEVGRSDGQVERADAVVVGAGHAGLAVSHFLSARGIEHVVLERGEVGNSWRRERWDSLRLLTPNWLSRLPGHAYQGPDPDGYMSAGEVAEFIGGFATASKAPVRTGMTVVSVRASADGYRVVTDRGAIQARAVILASGACNVPSVPDFAGALPESIRQLTPFDYTGPADLPDGGVLVVGGSATGVQLAAEVRRSGRPVVLSVGEHVRLPRTYRARDVLWWMQASGVWDQRHDQVEDLERARALPSPQLVGSPERATLDLNTLMALGVELVGRWAAVRDGRALFSGGLRNICSLADLKMERLLDTFDDGARANDGVAEEPDNRGFDITHTPALSAFIYSATAIMALRQAKSAPVWPAALSLAGLPVVAGIVLPYLIGPGPFHALSDSPRDTFYVEVVIGAEFVMLATALASFLLHQRRTVSDRRNVA